MYDVDLLIEYYGLFQVSKLHSLKLEQIVSIKPVLFLWPIITQELLLPCEERLLFLCLQRLLLQAMCFTID